ncbi:MAG: multicopper oxidase domain-containing protein, partial [Caldilineaceae bacterium]|nr:multicopper oxidase domain-containing protein [Caldilineaceae bacterium]
MTNSFSRRRFIQAASGTLAVAAGASLIPRFMGKNVLSPVAPETVNAADGYDLFYAGTDGWIALPESPAIPPFHPDNLAPDPFTTYIFGFRNLTGMSDTQMANQKNKAQHSAPLFWTKQDVPFRLQLTNLGLALRPDLFDEHTLHWHGFRNVIPFFDGEPTGSLSVPTGRLFTYVYNAHEPGTYMFHCHVEDVEHVHMGMTGMVFVRPAQDGNSYNYGGRTFTKFAYNDGDGSTGYDREFSMFLSEVWAEAHWADAHIQLPEWSDYRADFTLLNGRVYPDTIAPNGSIDPFNPVYDANGNLIPPGGWGAGYDHLQYQPISSLVNCEAGEHVLLRFSNLGFKEAAMTLTGIKMRVVGRDATHMRGRYGTDTSYVTSTAAFSPGESIDAIFVAPAFSGGSGSSGQGYDRYMLYNRRYTHSNNLEPNGGFGGQ